MRYRCEDCNYSLHKDCMFSKPTTTHEIFKNFIFKFYEQPPPSELYDKRTKRYCNACGKHVKGFIYHYLEEDLDLYPCCLNLKKELQIGHVKFHLCETNNGMRYKCEDCNYSLHKDCMFSKPITIHMIFKDFIFKFYEQPPHSELYVTRTKRYCNACGKHVKGFIYHCPKEDLDLHPCCLNLKKEFQIVHVKFHLCETKSKCKFCN
ncbi:hypothetical protein CFP56_031173 [Quercus suber]|uniref:DC1 domain-containing protein n=1 Tax=Quercus suber TaxID=58331 RepID=A0AAW0JMG8_QUESU